MATQIIIILLVLFVLERIITNLVLRPKFKQPKYKNSLMGCFAYSAQSVFLFFMLFASGYKLEYFLVLFFVYCILIFPSVIVFRKLGLK